jgi:diguanylate cyclase (GGDEF)-like protein
MRLSLKNRLLITLSLTLLSAFVLISVLNYSTARRTITHEITNSSLPLLRENIYSEIREDFLPSMNIASMMATDSFLKNWALEGENESNHVIQYLQEIRDEYGYKSTFFVSALTGRYYHYDGILKTISPGDPHDVWFYDFVKSNKEYELDVDTDEAARNRLTIFFNYRVEDYDGSLLGVAGVGIVMNDFAGYLRDRQQKYKRRIYLTDHQGLIQAHSDIAKVEREYISIKPGISSIAQDILLSEERPLNATYTGDSGRVLVTSRYIPAIDWFLIVEQDENAALKTTRTALFHTILIGIAASLLVIFFSTLTINRFHARLEELATTDSLTGCANRRELEKRLERLLYRKARYSSDVAFILIDVDNFKHLNDTKGHQTGDQVLRILTQTIQESIRPDDTLARWGGDEFVIVIEDNLEAARTVAERLRYFFFKNWTAQNPEGPQISLSMGIAELGDTDNIEALIKKADSALYQAKRTGKDKIQLY